MWYLIVSFPDLCLLPYFTQFSSKIKKTEYCDLGRYMYLVTNLYNGRKQDSAGLEGIPVHDCSREEALFIIVDRGGDMLIFGVTAVK